MGTHLMCDVTQRADPLPNVSHHVTICRPPPHKLCDVLCERPHSDILPVPIPPEQEKKSAYEDSKIIVEDKCELISDEEDDEIETEAEVSSLSDPMEPKLIGQKDLNDLYRDLELA